MVTPWRSVSTSETEWIAGTITTASGVLPTSIAYTRSLRRRGLLGLDHFDSILALPNTRWVHTLGMRFPIDVAHIDTSGVVVALETVLPNRITLPVLSARMVLESYAGMMLRHGFYKGMEIIVSGTTSVVI